MATRTRILTRGFLAAATAWTPAARAEDPHAEITGPKFVQPGECFILSGKNARSDRRLEWRLNGKPYKSYDDPGTKDAKSKDGEPARPGLIVIVESAVEGMTYTFEQVAKGIPADGTELDATSTIHIVTVTPTGEANPSALAPQPNAPPAPDPIAPVTGPIFVTYIADAAAQNGGAASQATFRQNPAIEQARATYDAEYRWFASNSIELQPPSQAGGKYNLAGYLFHQNDCPKSCAKHTGVPAVLFQVAADQPDGTRKRGEVVDRIKNPTPQAIADRLKALRGGK